MGNPMTSCYKYQIKCHGITGFTLETNKYPPMKTTIHKLSPKMNLLKMQIFILIFISFFTLLSCSNNDDGNNNDGNVSFTPQNINSILIGKGSNYNDVTPQNIKISNSVQWNEILEDFSNNTISTFTETDIDFTQFDVLVCLDVPRYHTAHAIEMVSIIENQEAIEVNIEQTVFGVGFSAVIRPYHIVKIPKNPKPVFFEVIEE
jgi:hypothetical protein